MPRKAKHVSTYSADWKEQRDQALADAAALPDGVERDELVRKARQLDTALHMREWLASPGLVPPSA